MSDILSPIDLENDSEALRNVKAGHGILAWNARHGVQWFSDAQRTNSLESHRAALGSLSVEDPEAAAPFIDAFRRMALEGEQ